MPRFSHLHVHTQYSLLDGASSIPALYKKAMDDNMPAVAISDHGNMFGVFQFVAEAYKNRVDPNDKNSPLKVKPIVGCEFYITENRHRKTFSKEEKDPRHHQILLAKNEIGYKNLTKLTSLGYIEGMYSKYPRIDKELIHKYHEGLIATTCCLGAMVPQTIMRKGEAEGENEFKWWLNIFQEDFYVELQRHGMEEQEKVNKVLLKFAKKYNVKVIASNDSHYVDQKDFNAHDILLCINTGEKVSTPAAREFSDDDASFKNRRFAFPNDQFFFKTTAEMTEAFHDLQEAIDNTNEIVDKVEVLDLKKDILLPHFPVPKNFNTQDDYLEHLTREGAKRRTAEIEERIAFELFTIKTMGFAGYFLIVSDFIKAGRDLGVFIGPGRGSAAGSVVAYCIGITNIDPIKYNLLFERFLNPDRKSMPDIDTDFDDEGRQKVIDYVVDKYGKNQVAQIITYGTMAAKMSIKDVARTLDLPLPESNALAKLVPEKPGISLKRLLHAPYKGEKSLEEKESLNADDIENVKKLREIYEGNDIRSEVLHEAEILEGSVRNTGIHAAGIIIAPQDLTDLLPVCIAKDSPMWVTQIEGSVIEDAGVIKMDFLGLKTLNIIKTSLELIKMNYGLEIDIEKIPLDDEKTFHLYQKGETIGTFQFESPGMQKYLRDLKPDKFEDLIAMNALYRPGPLEYIPNFINRKHGREAITYDLEEMKEFLEESYGITV
ncbi:MAG: polymerase subunit alpha, partial [Bacteroidota bacterium]